MPSILRHALLPTIVNPKMATKRVVGFVQGEVTGVTRPANIAESWALYDFEMHARNCSSCRNSYAVHRSGKQLCDQGHSLAQAVAKFLYMRKDGEAYSTAEEDFKVVRVEIQPGYDEARSLLRAIERSIRHKRPFLSMDRSYPVAPRLPERPKHHHKPAVVHMEAPAPSPRRRRVDGHGHAHAHAHAHGSAATLDINSSSAHHKRGTLYESDLAEQKRNHAKYNVQVREPSKRDVRERRHAGYYR
ncbi:hypothetical protein IWX90DRAFT_393607 [Phyllosticta citrichinensis]|uniref:Uncharacterized protein n=1 Tax=Phyllosticta citrichinensis TaxID=1130410 RepID=A0ABR1XFN2_9PEZI